MKHINISNRIAECKTRLDRWMQRDISLFGRILLTKVESLSRCIYPAGSLPISDKKIKFINQMNFNYIWKRKAHYIKKATIVKDYKEGGLQAIDFDCMNGTFKINWLKNFLINNNSFWFCTPRNIFKCWWNRIFIML